MALRRLGPGKFGWRRLQLRWTHVCPNDVAQLNGGISFHANLILEVLGFIHLVYTVAVHIILPTMIDTSEPVLFIAP
jgi:prolipoprotein diacylglyceryltransferase